MKKHDMEGRVQWCLYVPPSGKYYPFGQVNLTFQQDEEIGFGFTSVAVMKKEGNLLRKYINGRHISRLQFPVAKAEFFRDNKAKREKDKKDYQDIMKTSLEFIEEVKQILKG